MLCSYAERYLLSALKTKRIAKQAAKLQHSNSPSNLEKVVNHLRKGLVIYRGD